LELLEDNRAVGVDPDRLEVSEQRPIVYPLCIRCGQKHLGDCSTIPGRCYVCRGEHRLRDCPYLGKGCYYCHGHGHV
jgi:hypothetical protein